MDVANGGRDCPTSSHKLNHFDVSSMILIKLTFNILLTHNSHCRLFSLSFKICVSMCVAVDRVQYSERTVLRRLLPVRDARLLSGGMARTDVHHDEFCHHVCAPTRCPHLHLLQHSLHHSKWVFVPSFLVKFTLNFFFQNRILKRSLKCIIYCKFKFMRLRFECKLYMGLALNPWISNLPYR